MSLFDFDINSSSIISQNFRAQRLNTFVDACNYIRELPYKRNSDKSNLLIVLTDQFGTCSTKHALLKSLAEENNQKNVKLILGIFKMNKNNVPQISSILEKHGLEYIPEAHNYLSINNEIVDCTKKDFNKNNFVPDLIKEIEILPDQITDFKVAYHKQILEKWLIENPSIKISFEKLWTIREQCILALSK